MNYDAYQSAADAGERVRALATNAEGVLATWATQPFASPWRRMAAYYELVALAGFTHQRRDFGIAAIEVRGESRAVTERPAMATPFCQLLHFRKKGGEGDPKILLVAPMSVHRPIEPCKTPALS